jgi:hypothetical protein
MADLARCAQREEDCQPTLAARNIGLVGDAGVGLTVAINTTPSGSEQLMLSDNVVTQTIDNLVQQSYQPTEPRAAVIVVRNGEIIFRKGQGMANLELGMSIEPEMVFRRSRIDRLFQVSAYAVCAREALGVQQFRLYPAGGHY